MATILVVEDDADITDVITLLLEGDGHEVLHAASGAEALAKLRDRRPDVVLLDVMLPGMDGWSVLERIKSDLDEQVSSIPVLMVTARTGIEDRLRGTIGGALFFISKPFDPTALKSVVRDVLSGDDEPQRRHTAQMLAFEELANLAKDSRLTPGAHRT
jgi:DNA-binding response OmpR family regulator